jgi:hypothetical protein
MAARKLRFRLRFKRKSPDPAEAAQAFFERWARQFKLFTRMELKAGEAAVAPACQADPTDRTLAAKFMLIGSALKRFSRSHEPSAIKRYFLLAGNTHNCTRNFIRDRFRLSEQVSDDTLLAMIKRGRRSG